MRPALVALTTTLWLVAAGCGEDRAAGAEGESESEGEGIALEDLPAAYAEEVCSQAEACLGALGELFFDRAQCVQDVTSSGEQGSLPQMQAAIDAGTVVYHSDRAQECVDAIAAAGCEIFSNQPIEACEDMFEGSVDEGGACNIDEECAGADLYCENDACPGACAPRLGAGSECANDGECGDALVCDEGLDTCEAPGAGGAACGGGTEPDCAIGLACWGGDEMAGEPGECTDLAALMTEAEGDACDLIDGPLCEPGLSCVVTSVMPAPVFECQAEVASGAACNLALPDACPDEEYCAGAEPMTGDIEGNCEPLPGDGEACAPTFPTCATGAACIDETCVVLRDVGGDCEDDDWCHSGTCADGACAEPAACEVDDTEE